MDLLEMLKAVGFSEEQAKTAGNILRQYIAGEYIPKSRFDEVNEKNKSLAQDLGRVESERDAAEKRAKKAESDLTPLQEKIKSTQTEWEEKYNSLKANYEQKEQDRIMLETYNTRLSALKEYLKDGAYDSDMVIGLVDFDTLEVKDGKVTGADKAIEALRKEKPFLFKSDDWTSTAPISAPKKEGGETANFGETLAKRASAVDAQTEAASKKYFG